MKKEEQAKKDQAEKAKKAAAEKELSDKDLDAVAGGAKPKSAKGMGSAQLDEYGNPLGRYHM